MCGIKANPLPEFHTTAHHRQKKMMNHLLLMLCHKSETHSTDNNNYDSNNNMIDDTSGKHIYSVKYDQNNGNLYFHRLFSSTKREDALDPLGSTRRM